MSMFRLFKGESAQRIRRTTRLQLQALDDRVTPAQWPVAPVDQQGTLPITYGQYTEAGGVHFHEGTDILALAGSGVRAIEAGKVVSGGTSFSRPTISADQK